jgi:hypothetical protein
MGLGSRCARWATGTALAVAAFNPTTAEALDVPPAAKDQPPAVTVAAGENVRNASIAVDSDGTASIAWTMRAPSGGHPLVYCRLPRGATACARTQTLIPADADSFGTDVLIPDPGHIIILDERCCSPNATFAVESTDGGLTFGTPHAIGNQSVVSSGNVEAAAAGPGPFQVSLLSSGSGSGIRYQTAPIAGPETDANALLGGVSHQWYGGGIAFVDPTTPIVASTDLDTTYVQRFNGSGDQNLASGWRPQKGIPNENDPHLVGGPGGVFLMTRIKATPGSDLNNAYAVRPYKPSDDSFGAPVRVTEVGPPIFGTLREDGGGGLGAAWISHGSTTDKGKTEDPLRYASSADGGRTWKTITLANTTGAVGYDLRTGLAPDHGGWVLTDHNDAGPLQAIVVPAGGAQSVAGGGTGTGSGTGAGAGSCLTTVQITAKATATGLNGGCLKALGGGKYTADGDIRINGIDFIGAASSTRAVRGGAAHAASSGGKLDIDTTTNTVTASGAVSEKAGSVTLNTGTLKWDLDQTTKFTGLDNFHANLLGFGITGEANVQFVKGGTTISAHMQLPDPIAVTGDTTLHTDQAHGLLLDKIHVGVDPPKEVDVGVLRIKQLSVDYDAASDSFGGFAIMELIAGGEIKASFGFKHGQFDHASGVYGGPPLPLVIYAPDVTLNKLGFAAATTAKTLGPGNTEITVPGLHLAGGVEIGVGTAGGTSVVSVDALPAGFPGVSPGAGGLTFDFPSGNYPAHVGAGGKVKVLGIELGAGTADFYTSGLFRFSSSFALGTKTLGASANVAGAVDVPSGSFYAEGDSEVCVIACVSGSAIISSIGVAACADLYLVNVGVGYKWSDGAHVYFKGCDVGDYKPAGLRSVRDVRAGGTGSVTLKGGVPEGVIKVTGTGGVPGVTVTGPGGVSIASDPMNPGKPVAKDGALMVPNGDDSTTTVLIASPVGGAYSVTSNGGGTVTKIEGADGLPPLSFTGGGTLSRGADIAAAGTPRVTGAGRRRTLQYGIAGLDPKQERVELFESSASGVLHKLGDAKAAAKLPFTVADGPAGTRRVVAVVTRGGVPSQKTVLTTFIAPGPITPGRAKAVRVARRGTTLDVSWHRAANAARYVMRVKLSDGRTDTYGIAPGRPLRVRVPNIEGRYHGAITVTGYTKNGRSGPAASASVRAKKATPVRKRRSGNGAQKHCPPPGTAGASLCRAG